MSEDVSSSLPSLAKTQLLLQMANAVEDSNTRKRHAQQQQQQQQQQNHAVVDAETMEQWIGDLESATTGKPLVAAAAITATQSKGNGDAATAATSGMTSSLESDNRSHEEPRNSSTHDDGLRRHRQQRRQPQHPPSSRPQQRQRQSLSSSSVSIDPDQVRLLYTAMISFRENADLRYQLLELKHLDMRQSFLEIETRYNLLQAERDGWKQSCQGLQEVATSGAGSISSNNTDNNNNSNNSTSSALQNHTVPLLQHEVRSLSSQRSQLLQANLELRKQLKHVQILQSQTQQQQRQQTNNNNEKAGSTSGASCQRCHPELFAVKQSQVDQVMGNVVNKFRPSPKRVCGSAHQKKGNPITNSHRLLGQDSHNEPERIIVDKSQSNESSGGSMGLELEEEEEESEHQHEDNMNLMGLHLGGGSNHSQKRSHNHQDIVVDVRPFPTKQKSIVWSPPSPSSSNNRQHHHHHNHPNPTSTNSRIVSPTPGSKPKVKARMTPMLNSFMPLQQQQQQQLLSIQKKAPAQDIQVSPRRESGGVNSINISADPREIEVNPTTRKLPLVASLQQELLIQHPTKDFASEPAVIKDIEIVPGNPQQQEMGRPGMLDEFGRSNSFAQQRKSGAGAVGASMRSSATTSTTKTNVVSNTVPVQRASASQQQHQPQQSHTNNTNSRNAPPATRKVPSHHTRPRQPAQRHSVAHSDGGGGDSARNLEFHVPGSPATTGRHSLTGAQPIMMMNARHLEFSATPELTPPSPMRNRPKLRIDHPGGTMGPGGEGGEAVPPPDGKRRPPSHDTNGPTPPLTSRSHVTGRNNVAHPQPGVKPISARHLQTSSGHPAHHHHHPGRHQQQQPAKDNEEKPEKAPRSQSYFARIKKTLQQEI